MAKRNKPSDREWAQHVRERIQASNVLARLIKAFEGEVQIDSNQVKIGLGLLNKVLPDINHQIMEDANAKPVSHEDLVELLSGLVGPELAAKLLKEMGAEKPKQETQH